VTDIRTWYNGIPSLDRSSAGRRVAPPTLLHTGHNRPTSHTYKLPRIDHDRSPAPTPAYLHSIERDEKSCNANKTFQVLLITNVWQYYYYYYDKWVWLKCHKILRLQDHFTTDRTRSESSMIQNNDRRIVRHSPSKNIRGRVLFWGAAWKLSITSTRWRWTAGCSIHAKPRSEMRGRQ